MSVCSRESNKDDERPVRRRSSHRVEIKARQAHKEATKENTYGKKERYETSSRSRGTLDLSWLFSLKHIQGVSLLRFWQWVLSRAQKECPYERHALVEALLTRRVASWETHLCEVAHAELTRNPEKDQKGLRLYSVDEVRKVIQTMQSTSPSPLSHILERKKGTLRFGHALRQLKDASASSNVRELLEELAAVRTREQLFDILTRLMEICEVLDAKTYFLITPTDHDLKLLLDDEEHYSACTIAQLLRLLSTLEYPAKAEKRKLKGGENSVETPTEETAQ